LMAELQFGTIKEIFDAGLHDYLDHLQVQLNLIGDAMFQTYIFDAFESGSKTHLVQQEEQQQQQGA